MSFAARFAAAALARAPTLSSALARLAEARVEPEAPAGVTLPPDDGWLLDAIVAESMNRYDANHRPNKVRPVEFVVLHYTASPYNATLPHGADLARMRRWAARTRNPSSTHFIILRDGRLVQMVPLNARAWHVTSRWPWPGDSKGSINDRSIGVDFENVGWLKLRDGVAVNAYDGRHHGPIDTDERGKPWEPYTDAQLDTARTLMRRLGQMFPQLRDGNPLRLIGHSEAQPTRRDPGPLCPMDDMRAALLGGG